MTGVLHPDYRIVPTVGGFLRAECKQCVFHTAKHGRQNSDRLTEVIEQHVRDEHP